MVAGSDLEAVGAIDACEDVADRLHGVVVKNA
jgi:uncharacterized protein Yka (UPF0111/DUF47 family)